MFQTVPIIMNPMDRTVMLVGLLLTYSLRRLEALDVDTLIDLNNDDDFVKYVLHRLAKNA